MKKFVCILAVATFSLGLFSCESETTVEDTEALFETLKMDESSVDGDYDNNGNENNGGRG